MQIINIKRLSFKIICYCRNDNSSPLQVIFDENQVKKIKR